MPRKSDASKRYVVGNPRNIPAGRHILSNADGSKRWYEGDDYDGDVAGWLIERGFLVEVTDGS